MIMSSCDTTSEICGICRDDLTSDVKTLECNHAFHTECIDAWTVKVSHCPFCRAYVHNPNSVHERARAGLLTTDQQIIDAIGRDDITVADMETLVNERYIGAGCMMILIKEGVVSIDIIMEAINRGILTEYNIFCLAQSGYIRGTSLCNLIVYSGMSLPLANKLAKASLFSLDSVALLTLRGNVSVDAFRECINQYVYTVCVDHGRGLNKQRINVMSTAELRRYVSMFPKVPIVDQIITAIDRVDMISQI